MLGTWDRNVGNYCGLSSARTQRNTFLSCSLHCQWRLQPSTTVVFKNHLCARPGMMLHMMRVHWSVSDGSPASKAPEPFQLKSSSLLSRSTVKGSGPQARTLWCLGIQGSKVLASACSLGFMVRQYITGRRECNESLHLHFQSAGRTACTVFGTSTIEPWAAPERTFVSASRHDRKCAVHHVTAASERDSQLAQVHNGLNLLIWGLSVYIMPQKYTGYENAVIPPSYRVASSSDSLDEASPQKEEYIT